MILQSEREDKTHITPHGARRSCTSQFCVCFACVVGKNLKTPSWATWLTTPLHEVWDLWCVSVPQTHLPLWTAVDAPATGRVPKSPLSAAVWMAVFTSVATLSSPFKPGDPSVASSNIALKRTSTLPGLVGKKNNNICELFGFAWPV